jgi:hypothetical protein
MIVGLALLVAAALAADPIALENRRELFVDHHLIDKLNGAELRLATPRDEGTAFTLDKPWEGRFCAYTTIIHDGESYRAYYRGANHPQGDGTRLEVTCVAQSKDGKTWTKPSLGLFEVHGTRENNVVLAEQPPFSHNFFPGPPARRSCQ